MIDIFVKWAYNGSLEVPLIKSSGGQEAPNHELLVRLYCFGEKVRHAGFCDAVLAIMLKQGGKHRQWPKGEAVKIAFAGTQVGSELRTCLLEVYAATKTWNFRETSYPPGFLVAVLQTKVNRGRTSSRDLYEERRQWCKER